VGPSEKLHRSSHWELASPCKAKMNTPTCPSGETMAVNFEIPSSFLDENAIKEFGEMNRIIAFVQADGYINNIEKSNYYSFGESVEYKSY